jgi:phage-related protein
MKIIHYKTASGRDPVSDYVLKLTEKNRQIIAEDLVLIGRNGLDAPQVQFRQIEGKLWEIKTGEGTQQRIFYCIITGQVMVLLHACKKQKTGSQHKDVEKAKKRMKEVLL